MIRVFKIIHIILNYLKRILIHDKSNASSLYPNIITNKNHPIVKIAVLGAGKFAQAHLNVLSNIRNVKLVGVSNRGNHDISYLKNSYAIQETYNNHDRMLDETNPNAVFVIVSHLETFNIAKNCLNRSIPSFIEKPPGLNSKETEELAAIASKNSCLNMVGLNRRFISTIQLALIEILNRGSLKSIIIDAPENIRIIKKKARLDQKVYDLWLMTNTIHVIDLFRHLGGEVENIFGFKESWEEKNGDSFVSSLRLKNGCLGSFNSTWNTAGDWSLKLYGEGIKTKTSLGGNYETTIIENNSKKIIPVDKIDTNYKPGLYLQDSCFINSLAQADQIPYPAADLKDATKTMKLIEKIISSNK